MPCRMVAMRDHLRRGFDAGIEAGGGGTDGIDQANRAVGGRLNLLLSCAGWEPDPWIERLPRLLEPMGVQSHRVRTGAEATRVIEQTTIHIAVVDLGLPLDAGAEARQLDEMAPELVEGGARLLELLARLREPPPVVAVRRRRTHRDEARELAAALRWGAFAVVERPHEQRELDVMLEVLRRCLERHYAGRWPGGAGA